MSGAVLGVHSSPVHGFSNRTDLFVTLIEGLGVAGDAHAGLTVKHRSRVRADPGQPNLRQVHLIASELLDEVNAEGFDVVPGALGENVTTRGIALIDLPRGTLLHLGETAVVESRACAIRAARSKRSGPGFKAHGGPARGWHPLLLTGIMGVVRASGTGGPATPSRSGCRMGTISGSSGYRLATRSFLH